MHSKAIRVFVKKMKNATEQHDFGNKTNQNACIKFKCALNFLNIDYFILNKLVEGCIPSIPNVYPPLHSHELTN